MRVHFTSLGCKLNQAEIERLARTFTAAGHRVVGELAEADLHVINSCTVTHAAARDSRKAAGRARRRSLHLRTVLTGCYAAERPDEAARLAGVDLVVPNTEKDRLLERVHAAFPDLVPLPPSLPTPPLLADDPVPCCPLPAGDHRDDRNTRAMVKIEDGCNMRCAFCIIPATRGRQASRSPEEVIAETRLLVAAGWREVVLTGVQISAYRWGDARLSELVRRLLTDTEVPRLRLTSIAPWDLDLRLLELWREPRLARHLHLSLQSGSTATLRRMRRPYTAEGYLALLERARAAISGVAITTDVIVGFPGESEEEFAASLETVRAAGFARVHVFPFSPRAGTEAASLSDPVPPEVQRQRMERMLLAGRRAEREFAASHLGRRASVLWEHPRAGMGTGLTDNYLRVFCPEGAALWNRFSEVELVELVETGGSIGSGGGALRGVLVA